MKIDISTKIADLTPAFRTYIEEKLAPLGKFFKRVERETETLLRIEILRTTKHHKKGDVFMAVVNLHLPKRVIEAEAYATDARAAVDAVKDVLRTEIEKYRTKFLESRKKASKNR